jgi:hypothetical protein
MEVLKNWLLLAGALVVIVMGYELGQKTAAIERMAVVNAKLAAEIDGVRASEDRPDLPAVAVQTAAPGEPCPVPSEEPGEELLSARRELARFKGGLERCTEALNTAASGSRPSFVPAPFIPSSPLQEVAPPPPQADIVELREPYVLPSGAHVTISGKLYNRGTAAGDIAIVVTLFDNGRRRDSRRQTVSVGAGETVSWEQAFRWDGHEANWTAQVELRPAY